MTQFCKAFYRLVAKDQTYKLIAVLLSPIPHRSRSDLAALKQKI
jgi:hypothetical protein